jgi:hypothetical protein
MIVTGTLEMYNTGKNENLTIYEASWSWFQSFLAQDRRMLFGLKIGLILGKHTNYNRESQLKLKVG